LIFHERDFKCSKNGADVIGFEGIYKISSRGNVLSSDRFIACEKGERFHRGRKLKPTMWACNIKIATRLENQRDKKITGTQPCGEKMYNSKLKEHQVIEILRSTSPHSHIAQKYGITPEMVGKIRRGLAWKHISLTSVNMWSKK